ncbi:MAG: hypothetical protein IJR89_04625 [Clostridia bacterium]|nr:hypothetical protein [Clostridia bacterium]
MKKKKISLKELIVFAMLGALMFLSKMLLEWAPNVHLLACFTVAFTVVYRAKALFPVGVFIFLTGLYAGFNLWWYPYLYLWPLLWGAAMLLPKNLSGWKATVCYVLLCTLHGLLYGTLYAPYQALVFGLSFEGTLAWIAAGFPYDLVHAAGNFAAGFLVLPLVKLLRTLSKKL